MDKKLDITPELARASMRVIRDYCSKGDCRGCGIFGMCSMYFRKFPSDWELPSKQGGNTGGQTHPD